MLKVCLYPSDYIRLAYRACLTGNFTTRLEEHQGGNAADAKFVGDALRGIGIELRQAYFRFQLRSRLSVLRCHCPTGATPGRPEVHDYRNVIAVDVAAEIVPSELQRMTREQWLMTVPALRRLAEA